MAKADVYSTTPEAIRSHKTLFKITIFVIILLILSFVFLKKSRLGEFVSPGASFLAGLGAPLTQNDGRTNVLVLGRGGVGHEAPDLTDTIILASISHKDKKATLLSLPRDIWSSSMQAKINSAYYYGKLPLAKSSVSEVLGLPIHYAIVIDFSGFTQGIDALGGVEVMVERAFTDRKYPIPGLENDECGGDKTYTCRYETISFESGAHIMDGQTALKFARSRNAEGDEGTDFARAARQQKVIEAIKNKVIALDLILSPDRISKLVGIAEKSVITDLSQDEAISLARLTYDSKDNYKAFVLPEDLLVNPPISAKYGRQYVFIHKGSDWSEVQNWLKTILP